ncbi:MAG: tRNA pseudouridine(55) synthase TruB [Dehalococcoidales bacterium]|nr:tRNA pseudouridine(55) synthase TruB [Dehalococcoidales bacterium]
MDGILNVNKPAGITSYGVVSRLKRASASRAGHAGTLDPEATGVLPVFLGRATRLVTYLNDASKTYRAEIELGITTDTYDVSGRITGHGDPSAIDAERIGLALEQFRGTIRQTPPMFSAVKHRGQPLYRLARAGLNVERRSRTVHIYRLELLGWQMPVLSLEIECSKGTYIRSLAHDLGQVLGCGAALKSLVRTRYGIFDIAEATGLTELEAVFAGGLWEEYLYPPDAVLQGLPAVILDEGGELAMKQGRPVAVGAAEVSSVCRAYSRDGRFLGIVRYLPDRGTWQPKCVFV